MSQQLLSMNGVHKDSTLGVRVPTNTQQFIATHKKHCDHIVLFIPHPSSYSDTLIDKGKYI